MSARHVILDADFGDGQHFFATWAAWQEDAGAEADTHADSDTDADVDARANANANVRVQTLGRTLHYLAIAPQPPSASELASSLVPTAALEQLRAMWPPVVPGFHRLVLDDGRITLDLMIGAVDELLPQIDARVDQFYLPATAVAAPARTLAKLAVQGATLLARAPGEAQVWALTRAGFVCAALAGNDDTTTDSSTDTTVDISTDTIADISTEITVDICGVSIAGTAAEPSAEPSADISAVYASRQPQPAAPTPPVRRAIVIGAGLAGAAACERLCAHGWEVTLIERHDAPAQEASGNLAGIFMPLLSKDDNIPTRLSRAAFLHALRLWQRLGGVGDAFSGARCGVLQLARDAAHAQVQRDVIAAWDYPPDYARWLDADAAGALLARPTPHGGWLFEQGGWVHPASLCAALLAACGPRLHRVFSAEALTLHRVGDEWQVRARAAAPLASAPTVVLGNGTGARAIAQSADLPLSALRGQVTHLAADTMPALPLVVCREAYVTPASNGIVSAGATYDNDDDPALRADSQDENLARLAEILNGVDVAGAPLAGRVGFRCAAPDRLPLAGALPDYPNAGRLERLRDVPRHPGLHGLLGYASRGLIWAPLMAELLVSQLEGAPPPLEASLAAALDPGRFLLKERRRSQ